ncbi:MAG: PH domain-containing protein [Candidatus Micrarchaeota archaeon]|nr:PH domain-containing protein [Candidatus Micrarchaeota archaeon]
MGVSIEAYFTRRAIREANSILGEGEEILMTLRQSLITDIAPSFAIVTNKRVIIVNNSFFGLYLNHNLITPTDYNSIYFKQITSVVVVKGRIFESVNIRILGAFDANVAKQRRTEGEMDGIHRADAAKFVKLVNSLLLPQQNSSAQQKQPEKQDAQKTLLQMYYAFKGIDQYADVNVDELDYPGVLKLISDGKSSIVWLGSEEPEYISGILGINASKITKLDPDEIGTGNRELFEPLSGKVFVCYNGNISKFVAKYIKKQFGIGVYCLKHGVVGLFSGKAS